MMREFMDNAPRPCPKTSEHLIGADVGQLSDGREQSLIAMFPAIMIALNPGHRVEDINVYGCNWLDVERDDVLGQRFENLLPFMDCEPCEPYFSSVWSTGRACRFKLKLEHPRCRWLDVELVPVNANSDDDRALLWFVGRDISQFMAEMELYRDTAVQLQQALRDKEILLQELHHRVKNNLQVVSALLSLQARFVDDDDIVQVFHDSRARIHAIAMIHETLYQSSDGLEEVDFTTYLKRLVKASIFAHTDRSLAITPHFELDSVSFNLETAIPCGLLVNEILMNALQHAFPHQKRGTVTICLKQHSRPCSSSQPSPGNARQSTTAALSDEPSLIPSIFADDPEANADAFEYRYRLSICDDGIGFPETLNPETVKSVGMSIVRDLTYQLGGKCNVGRPTQKTGTCFHLLFSPLNYRKRM